MRPTTTFFVTVDLDCCKPGCERTVTLTRQQVEEYDAASRVVYCPDHEPTEQEGGSE